MDYGTTMKREWKKVIIEISNDDLSRADRATGEVKQCGPDERYYRYGVNIWLEQHTSQPEIDCVQRLIAGGYGPPSDMNELLEMDLRRWITDDRSQSMFFAFMKILMLCEVIQLLRSGI